MSLAPTTKPAVSRAETRKRLLEDFEFYSRKALKIRTKDAKVVPFKLNRAQLRLLEACLAQWEETGRIRVIILKARQLGFSTLVGGFLYWWISQHRATKGIIAFGVREGLAEDDVKSITNPKVIKLLRKAMLHDAGAKAVATKVKSAAKVVKPTRNTVPEGKAALIKKSTQRLQSGRGTDADAIAILAGRWS